MSVFWIYKSIFWKYFFLKIGSSPKSSIFSTGSGTSTQRQGSATGFVATGITIGKHNGETKRETTEKNEK